MNSRRFTAQCLPCFPTERIAHLGTADRCIHPPGRNEMIAITPPKIFSKEVAQNRPPHFPTRTSLSTRNRFTPNFQGWGLDENLKLKSPPYRGPPRTPASQLVPPPHAAHPPRRLHPALRSQCAPCSRSSLYDYARKAYKLNSLATAGKV